MNLSPRETLDTMLGYLGFVCEIEEIEGQEGLTLQIHTHEHERLTGRRGELLDDIQYLLNRLLQAKNKRAPRVHVDVEHYRAMREDILVQRVKQLAERVRQTGRPIRLEPMNSYDRRIVHNAFTNDPEIGTWSPNDDARLKRITLSRRQQAGPRQQAEDIDTDENNP